MQWPRFLNRVRTDDEDFDDIEGCTPGPSGTCHFHGGGYPIKGAHTLELVQMSGSSERFVLVKPCSGSATEFASHGPILIPMRRVLMMWPTCDPAEE